MFYGVEFLNCVNIDLMLINNQIPNEIKRKSEVECVFPLGCTDLSNVTSMQDC